MDPARRRRALVALAVARTVFSVVAVLLAPALWRDHFVLVVLLRPTKEVLLAAGFLVRSGRVALVPVVLASLPLLLLGVWLFFLLGKAFEDIAPSPLVERVLPRKRVEEMCEVVSRRGAPLVFLGRLAAFPSSLLAAGAGRSGMPTRRFLLADTAGALVSLVEIIGAGYVLGEAYDDAGPWVTVVGVAVLVAMAILLGRRLRQK
ncbi:MAG TPA: VTT domain-containing protein [Acidimicrobiales bacterium]|nr:VTT domain-containing protein [Acidimicrobiales bacterium]